MYIWKTICSMEDDFYNSIPPVTRTKASEERTSFIIVGVAYEARLNLFMEDF